MSKRFVKSADTSTAVGASQRDLERILRRYGAIDFQMGSNWEKRIAKVAFRVPDEPTSKVMVPVRLEVSIEAVAVALGYTTGRYGRSATPTQHGWEQAERVAWRHLVLWVDAACSAASAGLQKMSEAFLAHTLVRGDDGIVVRVIDQLNQRGEWRALLPAGQP
ncbi:MAG TPA: hypothetical protein VEU74_11885 [Gemmatimonadales bacterium]|nr:hypothetical protein [Gemmatimonadales bacterium]